jgi:hypothetical protein
LSGEPAKGILDTPEKAREFREEAESKVEPELRKLDKAARASHVKASQYMVG